MVKVRASHAREHVVHQRWRSSAGRIRHRREVSAAAPDTHHATRGRGTWRMWPAWRAMRAILPVLLHAPGSKPTRPDRLSVQRAVDVLRKQELAQPVFAPFRTDAAVLVADHRSIRPKRAAAVDLDRADLQFGRELQTLILCTEQIGLQAQFGVVRYFDRLLDGAIGEHDRNRPEDLLPGEPGLVI